jgi:hypothetical protein
MANKPETTYIKGVHKHLQSYYEKTNNPFRSGTADVWYSGHLGDLWVEYKYIERIPKNNEILPEVTLRQAQWLGNRFEEGRNVAVVLGSPEGGVVYLGTTWLDPITPAEFRQRMISQSAIAQWIYGQVGDRVCLSLEAFQPRPRSSQVAIAS